MGARIVIVSMNLKSKIFACVAAMLLAPVMAGHTQIVVTAATSAPGTNSATAPTLATSSSFDLSGGNAVALLVTSENSAVVGSLGATFAGQPMTLGVSANQANQWAGIFYLINLTNSSGTFEITSAANSSGLAYSAIALDNVDSVADFDAAANTSTSGNVFLNYTVATNGGFVLGAVVNNGFNSVSAPAPIFGSGNADQTLHGPELIPSGSSGHLHTYGDVPTAGTYNDVYPNRPNSGSQRNAYALLAFETDTPGMATNTFGFIDNGTEFVVDTGAGLVLKAGKGSGTITSWVYNGVEYDDGSGKGSHLISGLGSSGTSVSVTNMGNVIKITIQTDGSNGVVANLTHYFVVSNGVNNVYMATYSTESPGVGELRWITRLDHSLLPNGPVPSRLNGNTGSIESGDVFGMPDGTTRSKYYGDNLTHGKDRAMDMTYCGASGTGVGVWMVYGNRESSSGGPFYRDIQNQAGTDQEIYNYLYSGHAKIENWRQNVLNGPYALVWTDGATPTLPIDTSWMGSLGLTGWVDSAGRGSVSGTATGVKAGIQGVVGLASTTAQYWGTVSGGSYSIPGVKPGTYTAILYQGELGVATNNSVNVSAGMNTVANMASGWPDPPVVWKIGEWDGTPQGFLNATNILGFDMPNFITMHPTDVRMDPWPASGGSNEFTVGIDPVSSFMPIQARQMNGKMYTHFDLAASQITTLKLRLGGTVTYNGGRPAAAIFNSTHPSGKNYGFHASTPKIGRVWTLGTYRGYNHHWTWDIPAADLVVGQNTIRFTQVSGSTDLGGWLSAGCVIDCVQLDGPSLIKTNPPVLLASHAGNVLSLGWPDHLGWTLQTQTNSLSSGLGTNWVDVSGSTSVTNMNVVVDPAKPTVFYRLKL